MYDEKFFPIPLVIIIFNRIETTKRLFEEIKKIRPSCMYIIADGPRDYASYEKERCAEVRKYVLDNIDWNCDVQTNFSENNLGCKTRISSGLNWVFSMVDYAIILEDDCIPDPSFFPFCHTMLKKYLEDQRIMMIAGTNYLSEETPPEFTYHFSQLFPIWGWATWKRSWNLYDINMTYWPLIKTGKFLNSIYKNKLFIHYIERIFDDVFAGKDDTWDAQWFYSCIIQRGLCIMPEKNLVSNIGIDGTRPQIEKFVNRCSHQLDLNNIKEPPVILVNPHVEDNELRNLLKMAEYSYIKYFCTVIFKKFGIFNYIEKSYHKYKYRTK